MSRFIDVWRLNLDGSQVIYFISLSHTHPHTCIAPTNCYTELTAPEVSRLEECWCGAGFLCSVNHSRWRLRLSPDHVGSWLFPTRLSCSRGPWCGIIWEAPWRRRVPESTWGRHTALHFRPVTPTPGVCGTLPPVLQSSHASSLTDRPVRVYHSASQQPLFSQIFCRQAVTASHWAPDKELAKCLIVKSINTPRLPRIVAHTSFGKEK